LRPFCPEHYWLDHWTRTAFAFEIDAAANWGKTYNVPMLCNEFGAYRRVTDRLHA